MRKVTFCKGSFSGNFILLISLLRVPQSFLLHGSVCITFHERKNASLPLEDSVRVLARQKMER
jgi:hypothetical protein